MLEESVKSAFGTSRVAALILVCLAAVFAGCGSDGESGAFQQEALREEAQEARQEAARWRRAEARERREARRRQAGERVRERAQEEERVHEEEAATAEVEEEEASECDPNYVGACLDPYASDYDCEGGSGDGPNYTGPVTVVGSDHYGLDADGDGYGCE